MGLKKLVIIVKYYGGSGKKKRHMWFTTSCVTIIVCHLENKLWSEAENYWIIFAQSNYLRFYSKVQLNIYNCHAILLERTSNFIVMLETTFCTKFIHIVKKNIYEWEQQKKWSNCFSICLFSQHHLFLIINSYSSSSFSS